MKRLLICSLWFFSSPLLYSVVSVHMLTGTRLTHQSRDLGGGTTPESNPNRISGHSHPKKSLKKK